MNDNTYQSKAFVTPIYNDNYKASVIKELRRLEVILAAIEYETYDDGNDND